MFEECSTRTPRGIRTHSSRRHIARPVNSANAVNFSVSSLSGRRTRARRGARVFEECFARELSAPLRNPRTQGLTETAGSRSSRLVAFVNRFPGVFALPETLVKLLVSKRYTRGVSATYRDTLGPRTSRTETLSIPSESPVGLVRSALPLASTHRAPLPPPPAALTSRRRG